MGLTQSRSILVRPRKIMSRIQSQSLNMSGLNRHLEERTRPLRLNRKIRPNRCFVFAQRCRPRWWMGSFRNESLTESRRTAGLSKGCRLFDFIAEGGRDEDTPGG